MFSDSHHQFGSPLYARAHFPIDLSPSSEPGSALWPLWPIECSKSNVLSILRLQHKRTDRSFHFLFLGLLAYRRSLSECKHHVRSPMWPCEEATGEPLTGSPRHRPVMGRSLPGHSSPSSCRWLKTQPTACGKWKNYPAEPSHPTNFWGIIKGCCFKLLHFTWLVMQQQKNETQTFQNNKSTLWIHKCWPSTYHAPAPFIYMFSINLQNNGNMEAFLTVQRGYVMQNWNTTPPDPKACIPTTPQKPRHVNSVGSPFSLLRVSRFGYHYCHITASRITSLYHPAIKCPDSREHFEQYLNKKPEVSVRFSPQKYKIYETIWKHNKTNKRPFGRFMHQIKCWIKWPLQSFLFQQSVTCQALCRAPYIHEHI